MSGLPRVVVYEPGEDEAAQLSARLAQTGVAVQHRDLQLAVTEQEGETPDIAVVVADTTDERGLGEAADLLQRLVDRNVATLVCGASDKLRWAGGPLVDWVAVDTPLEELAGRLKTLTMYVPLVQRFERELEHMHRLGDQLNRYFSEIDQEMRLAGRLQRDFLPRALPEPPGFEFAVLYRPASWVSGDIYDVFRIDEHHVGIFLADAMGHGVAAGLLTMFLRQALEPKRVVGTEYTVVSPPEVLARLHACLVRQQLPNCQFITAVYAILDTRTGELRVSRGGHPYPFRWRGGDEVEQIQVSGGLLGLPDLDGEFEEARLTLAPGEKVIFFTDGAEEDFLEGAKGRAQLSEVTPALRGWAALPAAALVDAVREHLDHKAGSLHPADDVTLLVVEATGGAAC
jgi:sigma-B regulation protein RsbU (phosphoserine phosphatase)